MATPEPQSERIRRRVAVPKYFDARKSLTRLGTFFWLGKMLGLCRTSDFMRNGMRMQSTRVAYHVSVHVFM